ncbi:PAS domain-containing protein [Ferrovibrio sp.]|uniref:PAS domain-containing protein n=1 Tax=Ferrovibrio sp. TaxID=1917215 RepID=UPI0035B03253
MVMQRSQAAFLAAQTRDGLLRLFEAVCSDAAEATGASRTSLWYFEPDGSLTCQRQLDSRSNSFASGQSIDRMAAMPYTEVLLRDRIVAVTDIATHPATAAMAEEYLRPNGVSSLLDFLIVDHEDRPAAILCCEQCGPERIWSESDVVALYELAGLIGRTLRYQTGTPAQRARFAASLPFTDEPLLMEAALYWSAKRGKRAMPRRSDISPVDMPRQLLPHLIVGELLHDPFQVRFRLVGTEMVARYGRDYTGLTIDEFMTGDYAAYIKSLFLKTYETAAPVYSESQFKWNDGGTSRTRRLMLPLTLDGGSQPQQVLVAQVWPAETSGRPPSPTAISVRPGSISNSDTAIERLPRLTDNPRQQRKTAKST